MAYLDSSTMSPKLSKGYYAPRFEVGKDWIDRWPFIKRYNQLWLEGMKWYPTWRDQVRTLNPSRGFFFQDVPDYGMPFDHVTLIDSHCQRCIRDFASGMVSGMSSPAREWRKYEVEDKDLMNSQAVKLYFQQCNKTINVLTGHSNIYDGIWNVMNEIVSFGTASAFLMEDYEDVFRMRNFTIGEYFLGQGPDNRINAFARRWWMTVSQLVDEYGIDNCSPVVQAMYYNNQTDGWRLVIQLIEKNDDRVPEYEDFLNKDYRSITWEDGSQQNTYLRLEGYNEFPILAPRWQPRNSASIYGFSPGWDVLGDNKMLQMLQKKKLIGLDKMVDPPLQASSTIGIVNTLPGGVTRNSASTPDAGVKPVYEVQLDLKSVQEAIMETKQAISDGMFNDLFKMILGNPENPDETAYAIAEKQSERLSMLAPITEKLNNEFYNPLSVRQYNIAKRAGLLPKMPKELRGQKIKVKYVSIFAQAQRMAGLTAKTQSLGFIGQLGQIGNPATPPIDIVNTDNLARNYLMEVGLEPNEINPQAIVDKLRNQRAQAQAAQQKANAQEQQAKTAKLAAEATKAASGAPLNTGSALDSLMSGLGGGASSQPQQQPQGS